MKKNPEIVQELQTIAPQLVKIETGKNWYAVPENYFEDFEKNIMQSIAPEPVFATLASLKKENNYTVPEDYFEIASAKLLAQIHKTEYEQELAAAAPILAAINKQPLYTVDAAYFETFDKKLFATIAKDNRQPEAAKYGWINTISSFFEVFAKPSYQFAFASVTGIVMIVAVFFVTQPETNATAIAGIASLSNNEIANYIALNQDEFDMQMLQEVSVSPEKILDNSAATKQAIEKYLMDESSVAELEDELI